MHRRRLALAVASVGALAATLLPATGVLQTAGAVDDAAPLPEPGTLTLTAASGARMEGSGTRAFGDLGLSIKAVGGPVEIWSSLPDGHRWGDGSTPVTTIGVGDNSTGEVSGTRLTARQRARLFRGFDTMNDVVQVKVRTPGRGVVYDRPLDMCLSSWSARRTRPDAPSTSPYPLMGCAGGPFTQGAVQGLQRDWKVPVAEYASLPLTTGTHTVVATVTEAWSEVLGLETLAERRVTYPLRVRRSGQRAARPVTPRLPAPPPAAGPSGPDLDTGEGCTPPEGTAMPDLEALPAFGMRAQGDHLQFSATVWNSGSSPMVVDGFRESDEEMMTSYQNFYARDADGGLDEVGHCRVGMMHWHAAPSHMHWHFLDFARYQLLNADRTRAVRSSKQSFCLANTDAVDYTVPGADWQPDSTALSSACGGRGATSLRQVLSAGSGDTYEQFRAGQAFRLKGLANGYYWVEVTANPEGNLVEAPGEAVAADTALRKVWIGGRPGARKVRMLDVYADGTAKR